MVRRSHGLEYKSLVTARLPSVNKSPCFIGLVCITRVSPNIPIVKLGAVLASAFILCALHCSAWSGKMGLRLLKTGLIRPYEGPLDSICLKVS
ncbi:MAG: hypothetical protein DRG76_09705, partial [Deltaproteobacteria bacterium]